MKVIKAVVLDLVFIALTAIPYIVGLLLLAWCQVVAKVIQSKRLSVKVSIHETGSN